MTDDKVKPDILNSDNIEIITAKKRGRGVEKKTTTQQDLEILRLSIARVSQSKISESVGVSPATIYRRLAHTSKFLKSLEETEQFEAVRSKMLSAAEYKFLETALDEDRLAASSLRDAAYAYNIVHKSNRLERGLSTANKAVKVSTTDLDDCE